MHTRVSLRTTPAARPMQPKTATASQMQAALQGAEADDVGSEDKMAGAVKQTGSIKVGGGMSLSSVARKMVLGTAKFAGNQYGIMDDC